MLLLRARDLDKLAAWQYSSGVASEATKEQASQAYARAISSGEGALTVVTVNEEGQMVFEVDEKFDSTGGFRNPLVEPDGPVPGHCTGIEAQIGKTDGSIVVGFESDEGYEAGVSGYCRPDPNQPPLKSGIFTNPMKESQAWVFRKILENLGVEIKKDARGRVIISPGDIEGKACLLIYKPDDYPGRTGFKLDYDGILPVGTEGLEGSGAVEEIPDPDAPLPW